MRIRLFLLTAALICVGSSVSAQDSPENFGFEGTLIFWTPTPEIVLTSGTLGTPVDFINTFAVDDKRFRSYRTVAKAGKHKVRFSRGDIKYDATTTLTETVRFQGQTYTVGIPTTAELEWTLTRIGYEWDAVAGSRGFLGVFFDVQNNKMKAQLSAPSVTAEVFDRNIVVPTIGGTGRAYLTRYISITAEMTAFSWNRSNVIGKFRDLDVYGTANLGRNLGVEYGYRSLKVDYDVETDIGDLKLKGPYFGLLIRF